MARKLSANVHVDGRFFEAGSTPPKEFADRITNPKAWGEGEAEADDSNPSSDYGSMKVEDLEAAVDQRNADRDEADAIEVAGTGKDGKVLKKDLVAALEADDADNG